jgi:ATP-dependent Clp protease ATP-binding subunit ClpB
MTTNAGSNTSSALGFGDTAQQLREKTEKALLEFLRPEFINRIDEVICFNSLSKSDFVNIANCMLSELKSVLSEKGISFEWDNDVAEYLSEKSFSEKYGARNLRRVIQTDIEDAIASVIIGRYKETLSVVNARVSLGKIEISVT